MTPFVDTSSIFVMAPAPLAGTVLDLDSFRRERARQQPWAPLEDALGHASNALRAIADGWSEPVARGPWPLAEEVRSTPGEIWLISQELRDAADASEETGVWLDAAMERSWTVAEQLLHQPALTELLGERHRIIAGDWQNAQTLLMVSRLIRRAVDTLDALQLTPSDLREDLGQGRSARAYLHAAAELLDRAGSLLAESAVLVTENERRWAEYSARVAAMGGLPER